MKKKLTGLLLLGLPGLDKLGEALELRARHSPISSLLYQQIFLEMLIKVLFEGGISDESHTTNCALKLDSLKNFILSGHSESKLKKIKESSVRKMVCKIGGIKVFGGN